MPFLLDNYFIIKKNLSTTIKNYKQCFVCSYWFIPITAGSCTRLKAKLQFPVARTQIKTIQSKITLKNEMTVKNDAGGGFDD